MTVSRFDLEAVYALLVSKVQEVIETCREEGVSSDIEYYAWDARQDVNELPSKDLIGVVDWTYDQTELHMPEIEFGILLSVYHDKNLFREVAILERIRRICIHPTRPEYLVWTMKDDHNDPFAQLQVTDFSVMPAGESEARSVRTVGISLKRADYAR